MAIFVKVVHVFAALFLVLVVLLQSGRGGGMGAAFGGASGHIFGGRGAAPFLAKVTTGAAIVFFLTSMSLSAISSRHRSVLQGPAGQEAAAAAPATPSATDAAQAEAGSDAMKTEQAPADANQAAVTP